MRWKTKTKSYPAFGQIRYIRRFLWRPITLNEETRWLEFAVIKEEYKIIGWVRVDWCAGKIHKLVKKKYKILC